MLNTIRYLARLQNVHNIEDVTKSLIELLRISIGNGEEYISIGEELEHVRSYINIQKYKYSDKFSVIYQVEKEILEYKTLKLILQPIVENALIHGIEPLERNGLISIKIIKDAQVIRFIITDSGAGMTEKQIESALGSDSNKDKMRFSGIGISNVNERIKLFFGEEYGLKIYSQVGLYTTIEVSIPLIPQGDYKIL